MEKTSLAIPPQAEQRLCTELAIWLTTVRADGMPLPTLVAFLWDGASVLIYTSPGTLKLRNIAANPYAALNLNSDALGRALVVLYGRLREDRAAPPVEHNAPFLEKYRAAIAGYGMTPERFSQRFCVPLRFTPERIRVD